MGLLDRSAICESPHLSVSRNTRMTIKPILIGITVLALAAVAAYFLFPIGYLFYHMSAQMRAGQSCMDSITEHDVPMWIERTEEYLSDIDPNSGRDVNIGEIHAIPLDLKNLGILRIDVNQDFVRYVWAGGLDHTFLEVLKTEQGDYRFTANYDDESSKVIWPK